MSRIGPCCFRKAAAVGDVLSSPNRVLLSCGREADTTTGVLLHLPQQRLDLGYGFIVPLHRPYVDPYERFSQSHAV
jgi:hypothetical protein